MSVEPLNHGNLGSLPWSPALESPELLADPVRSALTASVTSGFDVLVAPIDPTLADTAAFCERYSVPLEASANCVVIAGRRAGDVSYAACLVLATTRADVNGAVRRRLGARKASFAPVDDAVQLTAMEFGGITPVGLPSEWPVLVDPAVLDAGTIVIGSGVRRSKLAVSAAFVTALPNVEVIDGLAS